MDRRQFLLSTGCLAASAAVPGVNSTFPVAQQADADTLGSLGPATDYADASHVDDWLRHPVFGDPSFDSFQHASTNPVFRGSPPLEWPVNGFYFIDPVSKNHYLYVGDYPRTYIGVASHCILFRSTDEGKTWMKLPGWIVPEDPNAFDADTARPDICPTSALFTSRVDITWSTIGSGSIGLRAALHTPGPTCLKGHFAAIHGRF